MAEVLRAAIADPAAADKVAVRARYLGMLEGCLAQEAKLAA